MKGLSTSEVATRLTLNGFNELPSAKPKNIWRIAKEVIKEPMFLLLISCGSLYITLGDYKEGIILLLSILIIIFITFFQYQKTEKSLEALKKLSSPRALVIRDGIETRIPGREVVLDDLIILNEGDRIAADAVILESINLTVDESLLTGESLAVTKDYSKDKTDINGLVFSGTLVIHGKGLAKVIATGINTQFGKIGTSLHKIEENESRLQKEMKILIRNLLIASIFISALVVVAFYLSRGHFLQSLLNGLAASIAILPEEFPVVLTVFLAIGAWRLSKINVLTRKPSAIESLGSATVLCSDKTGTITQNKMEIVSLYNGNQLFKKKDFNQNKTLIRDVLIPAYLASQKQPTDSMEKAILKSFQQLKIDTDSNYKFIKEYPLSNNLFAMTRIMEKISDRAIIVSTKGAPETIFALCKMTKQETSKHLTIVQQMAEQGYRVIGVATSTLHNNIFPENQQDFDFNFVGLIGFEDPIRPEVPKAIQECKEAGIKVIIITGDYAITAKSIAKQIGLTGDEKIITGDELDKMSDEELSVRIKNTVIFARAVPDHKLRIVQALKANNEIVAMTGDGVNDAPSLKASHIGIAMGNKGTDVAREASSLVLLDDNFASIVAAIRSGRRIFDNLQKAMSYIMAIHIPIIGLTLLPAFIPSLPILLMPLHIVFMELIIDPSCSIAFEYEQEEKGIMKRAPRDPNEQFFGGKKILYSVFQGLLLLIMVAVVYFITIDEGHSDGEVRAITFSSLIIGNIFLILNNLSNTRSLYSTIMEKNIAVIIILSSSFLMLLLIISIPYLQQIFKFEFPEYQHFLTSIIGAFILLIILEIFKFIKNKISIE
ncbi:MAG: cation-translocating P-type ATPase [Flavobacteriaceae bacterium]|nr:cation-translocating P-type ATPase [Flavobacteriaceae bacterium]